MTIEVVKEDGIITIEDTEAGEDITITELISGEFEIEATFEVGEKYSHRTFVVSREQMKDIGEWIVGRLR